jgi:hypothetical protein
MESSTYYCFYKTVTGSNELSLVTMICNLLAMNPLLDWWTPKELQTEICHEGNYKCSIKESSSVAIAMALIP